MKSVETHCDIYEMPSNAQRLMLKSKVKEAHAL